MNTLSVIVPCRNGEKTLYACLVSITGALKNAGLSQAETIVVLDGCTDGSKAIADELANRSIVTKGLGRSAARNEGAGHCTSEYLVFVDADCILEANFFVEILQLLKQTPAPDWIQATIFPKIVDDDVNTSTFLKSEMYGWSTCGMYNTFEAATLLNELPKGDSASCCIRSETFRLKGGFDLRLARGEDRELCHLIFLSGGVLRSASKSKTVKIVEENDAYGHLVELIEESRGFFNSSYLVERTTLLSKSEMRKDMLSFMVEKAKTRNDRFFIFKMKLWIFASQLIHRAFAIHRLIFGKMREDQPIRLGRVINSAGQWQIRDQRWVSAN